MRRLQFPCRLALAVLAAACGKAPAHPPAPSVLEPLRHDFGVIPHGEARTHDYVFDSAQCGIELIPLRAQLDCSCGHAVVLLRKADGSERLVDGSPSPVNAPTQDETVVVRVTVDTRTKDPIDLPAATSRGYLVLQPKHDGDCSQRVQWPLLVQFGIDTPVLVKPFAAFDFERVPASARPELMTTLAGDEAHPQVHFGAVHSSDPAIAPSLEALGTGTALRVRCTPGEPGNHRAVVSVDTDLPSGYRVNFSVTWKVVPDLEAAPMAKLSFRADLGRAQTETESRDQFLVVTDHDVRRTAEFVVRGIVGDDGNDASPSFAVTFAPIPQQPRQQRVYVRYLGGRTNGFRGKIVLGKPGDTPPAGPRLELELVVFAARNP